MRTKTPARSAGTPARTVAIDLGATEVRAVEVEWIQGAGGETARILRRGAATLGPNVWQDVQANRDLLATAVRDALSVAGITAKTVVACLPRRLVTLRFARLPHAPPEQMRGMVTFEAQQYILFSLDEVILDYHVIDALAGNPLATGEDLDTVLLAAARRSIVAGLMAVFEKAGLELAQLSVSALALAEHARDAREPVALIDIEAGEMDVAVVGDSRLLFTRATALDIQGARPEVAGRRLAEEVARSFTAYQNEFRQRPLSAVFLAGSSAVGADSDLLQDSLTGLLEMPVTRLQSRLLPADDPEAGAYATAVGMAMQTRPGSLSPINLVPNERAELRAADTRRRRRVAAVVTTFLGLFVVGLVLQSSLAQKAKLQREALDANRDLDAANAQLDTRKKSHDRLLSLDADLARGLDRDHPVVDILAALNRALPAKTDLWLTQFTFERNNLLTLRGNTKSPSAATDMVIALQKSRAFSDVRLGYIGDAQDVDNGNSANGGNAPAATATTGLAPGNANAALPGLNNPGNPARPGAPNPTVGTAGRPPAASTGANAPTGTNAASGTTGAGNANPIGGNSGKDGNASGASRRSPVTTFIITCRVNASARDLLPGVAPMIATPAKADNAARTGKTGGKPKADDTTDTDTENGGDDGA